MLPPWQRTPLDGGDMEDTRKLVEIVPADFSADVGRRAQDGQPI